MAGEMSAVAPFEYLRLPFAVFVGWLIWGETPVIWTYVGAAIVIASALYIAHREAELARQRNTHPVELMIDMALERDMKFFMMQPVANENDEEALELMKHPRSVVTFSDSGGHALPPLVGAMRMVRVNVC